MAQAASASRGDVALGHSNVQAVGGAVGLSFDGLRSLARDQATGAALARLLLCREEGRSEPLVRGAHISYGMLVVAC